MPRVLRIQKKVLSKAFSTFVGDRLDKASLFKFTCFCETTLAEQHRFLRQRRRRDSRPSILKFFCICQEIITIDTILSDKVYQAEHSLFGLYARNNRLSAFRRTVSTSATTSDTETTFNRQKLRSFLFANELCKQNRGSFSPNTRSSTTNGRNFLETAGRKYKSSAAAHFEKK